MHDDDRNSNDGPNFSPVIGFAIGALVGGVLGLLLAPASGEKTRRRLTKAARRLSRNARHTIEDARDTVTDATQELGSHVKSAIDAGQEMFRKETDTRDPRSAASAAQRLATPTARNH